MILYVREAEREQLKIFMNVICLHMFRKGKVEDGNSFTNLIFLLTQWNDSEKGSYIQRNMYMFYRSPNKTFVAIFEYG